MLEVEKSVCWYSPYPHVGWGPVLVSSASLLLFLITHLHDNLTHLCGNLKHVEKIEQMPIFRCRLQTDPGASGCGQCFVVLLLPAALWCDVERQRKKGNTSRLRRKHSQCTDE